MLTKISKLPATGRQLIAIEAAKRKQHEKQNALMQIEEESRMKELKVVQKHKKMYEQTIQNKSMALMPLEPPMSSTKKESVAEKASHMRIVQLDKLSDDEQIQIGHVFSKYKRAFKLLMKK